jgi:pyridoxine kinase
VRPGDGPSGEGLHRAAEVSDFLLEEAAAVADIMCPNQLELDSFSGRKPQSLFDCLAMAQALLARGPKAVLVKHLDYPGKPADGFEMLLVTAEGSWHLRRPLLAFPRQPVGVGDLTSGLFLARVLLGDSLVAAFEFTAAAVHECCWKPRPAPVMNCNWCGPRTALPIRACGSRRRRSACNHTSPMEQVYKSRLTARRP